MSLVVHCKRAKYDVYVGRSFSSPMHYGNPFSHKPSDIATVHVTDRDEAIQCFRDWISGNRKWAHVERQRRLWILRNLIPLRGMVLGCWCAPLPCHADVLVELSSALYVDGEWMGCCTDGRTWCINGGPEVSAPDTAYGVVRGDKVQYPATGRVFEITVATHDTIWMKEI